MSVSRGSSIVDTAFINANVITVDKGRPRAEAVAIGQGRFLAVGTTDEIRGLVGPKTEVVDLAGKTVVPGFIDAHLHALGGGVGHTVAVDCDLRSIGEIQEALRARRRDPGRGMGAGFQVRRHEDGREPTADTSGSRRRDTGAPGIHQPPRRTHVLCE